MVSHSQYMRMTVEECLALDRASSDARYEYLDGYAYLMSGGTPQHALVIGNMQGELARQLRQQKKQCRAYPADATVWLSQNDYVHPDVVVTCHEQDLASTDSLHFPKLVVEVLSPGTEKRDRGEKMDWYRACTSIQKIVLIRIEHPLIEVYRREENEKKWQLQLYAPGEVVELTSLQLLVPVDLIYEEITFPEPKKRLP